VLVFSLEMENRSTRLKEYFVTSFSTMRDVDASYDHDATLSTAMRILDAALARPCTWLGRFGEKI